MILGLLILLESVSLGAVRQNHLSVELGVLQKKIIAAQGQLISLSKEKAQSELQLKKIKELSQLQMAEIKLAKKRQAELENVILQLEKRRHSLLIKNVEHQREIRKSLEQVSHSLTLEPVKFPLVEQEKTEEPKRRLLTSWVGYCLKQIEILKADLEDTDRIEAKIAHEKQQMESLVAELEEQESLLKFHKQIEIEKIEQNREDRMQQLARYHDLKQSESEIEGLLTELNARVELEKMMDAQREVSRSMVDGEFFKNRGKLLWPIQGKLIGRFGRQLDPLSKLNVFKKGVEILADKGSPVRAVFSGKVAYTGVLPKLGKVAIIDHGEHFYTLLGQLGSISKNTGETVKLGETMGWTDDAGSPIYFEVRSRNVAVDPLQWIAN